MKPTFLISALLLVAATNAQAERPLRGFYEVPVENAELKGAAIFPVKFKLDNYDANPNSLDFPLPEELTGAPLTVHMETTPTQNGKWEGPNVAGDCQKVDREFVCNVRFTDLPIDAQAVDAVIQNKYANPQEALQRLNVAKLFASEPKGIIRYKLRGRDRSN